MRELTCVLLAASAVSSTSLAGPITPPPGPVAGTGKVIAEVEPRVAINATNTPGDADSMFKIAQRGSYYLTGNITGVAGKHGIEIAASGVTLDLNGFDLAGVPGSFDGVATSIGSLANIAVVNGSVRNWDSGIDLGSVPVTVCRVEGVQCIGNAGDGIYAGHQATISRCTASGALHGIRARDGATISECSATRAATVGIGCEAGGTIKGCSAYNNLEVGLSAGHGCTLSDCSAYLNLGEGILAGQGCALSNCSVDFNSGDGIVAGVGCTLWNCSVQSNAGIGITVETGSTVEGCSARFNVLDGIRCGIECVIRGNICVVNGVGDGPSNGAGIYASGSRNRIEGNTCTNCDVGIDVGAAGNIIIKNACSSNRVVNWNIAANNVCGPILNRTAPASGIVFGDSAPSSLGTTDANANFTY